MSPFAAALKYSTSSSAINKGDLGWINANSLTNEILLIIKNMEIGEISEPINKKNYEVNNPRPRMPKSVASQEEGLKALDKLTRDTGEWMKKRDKQIAKKEMTIKMWKNKSF